MQAAFVEPLGPSLQAGVRAVLDAAPDPFTAIVAASRTRERDACGAAFDFDHVADGRYLLDVRRCFFHDVLSANGKPELTTVMCRFDRTWIDAIDSERHGIAFHAGHHDRTRGTHCRFRFRRTAAADA